MPGWVLHVYFNVEAYTVLFVWVVVPLFFLSTFVVLKGQFGLFANEDGIPLEDITPVPEEPTDDAEEAAEEGKSDG